MIINPKKIIDHARKEEGLGSLYHYRCGMVLISLLNYFTIKINLVLLSDPTTQSTNNTPLPVKILPSSPVSTLLIEAQPIV